MTILIEVIHCDICDVRHKTIEAAIKCCSVTRARAQIYYECPLCRRFFNIKAKAKDCLASHIGIQQLRAEYLNSLSR